MRIIGIAAVLFILILVLCSLAPTAGAISIVARPIPDDGLIHKLVSGERSSGTSGTALTDHRQADGIASIPYAGIDGLCQPVEGVALMSNLTAPACGNVTVTAGLIGHTVSPSMAGSWNLVDPGSIQTNRSSLKSLLV